MAWINLPKVSTLEARRLTLGNVQSDLEARVENVQKTIGEAPEEEEHRDESDWDNRLAGGDLGCTSDGLVAHSLAAAFISDDLLH